MTLERLAQIHREWVTWSGGVFRTCPNHQTCPLCQEEFIGQVFNLLDTHAEDQC